MLFTWGLLALIIPVFSTVTHPCIQSPSWVHTRFYICQDSTQMHSVSLPTRSALLWLGPTVTQILRRITPQQMKRQLSTALKYWSTSSNPTSVVVLGSAGQSTIQAPTSTQRSWQLFSHVPCTDTGSWWPRTQANVQGNMHFNQINQHCAETLLTWPGEMEKSTAFNVLHLNHTYR